MRHLRIVALCLTALFALGATAVASASAETLPEIWECAKAAKEGKIYKGHYSGKKCEESTYHKEGGQKYEFQPFANPKPKTFKAKGGPANLSIENVSTVSCAKSAAEGHFSGPKTVSDILATFTHCETAGLKCENTAEEGEVKTEPLTAVIGFFDESKGKPVPQEVGVDLSAEKETEGGYYEAHLHCGSVPPILNLRVKGSVIGEVVPGPKSAYDKFAKEVELNFEEIGGKQAIQKFETGLTDTLITETCKGCTPTAPEDNSAESTETTGKGEYLYLKTTP